MLNKLLKFSEQIESKFGSRSLLSLCFHYAIFPSTDGILVKYHFNYPRSLLLRNLEYFLLTIRKKTQNTSKKSICPCNNILFTSHENSFDQDFVHSPLSITLCTIIRSLIICFPSLQNVKCLILKNVVDMPWRDIGISKKYQLIARRKMREIRIFKPQQSEVI